MKLNLFRKAVLAIIAVSPAAFSADVFVRDLPNTNINSAGANRSNVDWANGFDPTTGLPFLIGDDFTFNGGGTITINSLSVWEVANGTTASPSSATNPNAEFSSISLYGGTDSGLSLLSSTYSYQQVTYANGENYVGFTGLVHPIYELTFSNLGWVVNADGTFYDFALDGTPFSVDNSLFLHASNAALAGSQQDGADNLFGEFENNGSGLQLTYQVDSNGFGWDKSSDIDVILSTGAPAVPEPATFSLIGAGLLGLGILRKRLSIF